MGQTSVVVYWKRGSKRTTRCTGSTRTVL